MAGKGPAPADEKVRRNKDAVPTAEVAHDDQLRGPELPDGVLPLEESWHPQTVRWWNTWRRSPQAALFLETDWDFLLDTAAMHHAMWTRHRWDFASEVRLRTAKFGATVDDRARLRMKITPQDKPSTTEGSQPPAGQSHYSHLRSVK